MQNYPIQEELNSTDSFFKQSTINTQRLGSQDESPNVRENKYPADLSIQSKIPFCVGTSASLVVIKQVSLGHTLLFSSFRDMVAGNMSIGHMSSHMTV